MINIIYEDNHLLVVEKPFNMPVQADDSKDDDLLNLLKKYLKEKYNKPGNVYLGLVHRLDRPTSGLMVFAKTSKAASRLSKQIKEHKIKKTYMAIVEGNPKTKDTLKDLLYKDTKKNISYVSNKGKEAILEYQLINTNKNLNLVKINLITGRSHQIRVQFSSRKMPLLGDQKYNPNAKKEQLALIATELSFIHPTTKEKLYFEVDLPNSYPWNIF